MERRIVFVGGLSNNTSEEDLLAAFVPFGPVRGVEIPRENISLDQHFKDFKEHPFNQPHLQANAGAVTMNETVLGQSRGFGYVEFEEADDAVEAVENMDNAELGGNVLRVEIAKRGSIKDSAGKVRWHDLNEWYTNKIDEELDDQPKKSE